MHFFAI